MARLMKAVGRAETRPRVVPSPCTAVCHVGTDGLCDGCNRTIDEIGNWLAFTDFERAMVMRALPGRRG